MVTLNTVKLNGYCDTMDEFRKFYQELGEKYYIIDYSVIAIDIIEKIEFNITYVTPKNFEEVSNDGESKLR